MGSIAMSISKPQGKGKVWNTLLCSDGTSQ